MKEVLVAGLGNVLMGDEGVGVRLLRELARGAGRLAHVEFVELGCGGMKLLHAMVGRRKVILLDCARMGQAPGAIRRLRLSEARSRKRRPNLSLHEADLLELLALSRRLGECPEEIVLFAVEPETIRPAEGLSPALRERMEQYVRAIMTELEETDAEG